MRSSLFRRAAIALVASVGVAGLPSAAYATDIPEANPNDTLATAQDLSGHFSLDSHPDMANSATIPHATVVSAGSESSYDYYSFTVAVAGSIGTFDIDYGALEFAGDQNFDFDSTLRLFDSNGAFLFYQDDASVDPGSFSPLDSYLTYTFANAGTYFVQVGNWAVGPANGDYQLHVSLENPGVTGAVPEPGTWAMMLLGFGAAGFALRRGRRMPDSSRRAVSLSA